MSRLIDTSELHNVVTRRKDEYGRLAVEVDNIVEEMVKETPTVQAIRLDKVKKAREEISKQFVDLQDGSEEWRSYVNETVLECVEIMDKLIAESEG